VPENKLQTDSLRDIAYQASSPGKNYRLIQTNFFYSVV